MDTGEKHISKRRPEVEGMNIAGNHMVEDTTLEVKWVER
jgi:hypothetical protein